MPKTKDWKNNNFKKIIFINHLKKNIELHLISNSFRLIKKRNNKSC